MSRKKFRTGLKGLRVAPLIKDISPAMSEDSIGKIEYGAIRKLKDVQSAELTMRKKTASVDADDDTDDITVCTGCDGTIKRTFFEPEELAMLLDETILEDGSVISSEEDEPGEFAVGFYSKINGGEFLAQWLFRAKFSTPDMSAESAGNENLNPQSDSISLKSMKRQADSMWRIYKNVQTEEEANAFLTEEKLNKLYAKKRKETSDEGTSEETTPGVTAPEEITE